MQKIQPISFLRMQNEVYKILDGKPVSIFFEMLKDKFPYSKGSLQKIKQPDFEKVVNETRKIYGKIDC